MPLKQNSIILLKLSFCIFLIFSQKSEAQEATGISDAYQSYKINDSTYYHFSKPKFFDMVTNVPGDLVGFGGFLIQRENVFWLGASLASTVDIIPFDQDLLDGASKLGSNIGWDKDHSYSKIGGLLSVIPNDINSAV